MEAQHNQLSPALNAPTFGPGPRYWRPVLGAILLAAAGVRLAILIFAELHPHRFDFPDSRRYLQIAENVAAGLGPVQKGIPGSDDVKSGTDPLYPILLAGGIHLGFATPAAVMTFGRIIGVVAGFLSVLLLALLTRRLLGPGPALVAAGILAIDPVMLYFNVLVLAEASYTFILLAAMLCFAISCTCRDVPIAKMGQTARSSSGWALVAGILLGLGTLLRSGGILLPLFLAPLTWLALRNEIIDWSGRDGQTLSAPSKRPRGSGLPLTVFLLAYAFTLSPAVIRNYRLSDGRFMLIRTAGTSLLDALGPWADGASNIDRIQHPDYPASADEFERDALCRQAAWRWAAENPGQVARLAVAKLRRTWSVEINATAYGSLPYRIITWISVAPIFALAIIGVFRLRRRPALLALLLSVPVYFTLLHMVFVGSIRYRIPAMPFVFTLAAVGLAELARGAALKSHHEDRLIQRNRSRLRNVKMCR